MIEPAGNLKTILILWRIWSSDPSVSSDKKSIFETYSGIKSTNGEHRRVFTIGFQQVSLNKISTNQNSRKIIDQSEFRNFPYINLRQRSVFHTFLLKLHFCLRRFSNRFSSDWFSRLTNHDQLKTLLSSRWSDIPPRKFVPCPSKGLITNVNCSFKRFSKALFWLDERSIQWALVVYK